jgi:hypothetical protein
MPIALACMLVAGVASDAAASTPTIAAVPIEQLRGRGAAVPFTEYEAEDGESTGSLIGPSRRFSTIAAEASGRRAVKLLGRGQFVQFTLQAPANAVTVRYAIPDSRDGRGRNSTLGVYVGDERIASLHVTSRYGWFYGSYPFTNRPSDGRAHHFFDEARLLLGRVLPTGAQVRIAIGAGDDSPWYVVDLADFELVPPPLPRPANAISIQQFGADPSGRRESSWAVQAAIRAARSAGAPVWIGEGTFRINRHIEVDRVAILGAGPWYSVLTGRGIGIYGKEAPRGSAAVHLSDFAVIGDVRERVDRAQLAGIGGAMEGGSTIRNLWLQHNKVGVWLDGPLDGLTISGLRILDNAADGINLHRGVANAVIEQNFIRNSGDDGIASWSHSTANSGITIRNNSIVAPVLANGIAVYGGRDIVIADNFIADTLTEGGGIHLGNRFNATPVAGSIRLSGNLLVRAGSYDPNWKFGVGALWFYALDYPIDADVEVTDMELVDSTISAIQFIGKPIQETRFKRLTIAGANHWLQLQSDGGARFTEVSASGLAFPGYVRCHSDFRVTFQTVPTPLTRASNALCGTLDARIVDQRLSR